MKKEIKTHFKLQSFLNTYKEIVLEKDGANLGTIKQYKLKKKCHEIANISKNTDNSHGWQPVEKWVLPYTVDRTSTWQVPLRKAVWQ